MAQTTIQGSFLGDATVTGAKVAADFISAQTALTTGLSTTDEIIVSDAGVIKRMDISVLEIAATQITANGTLPALNGAALTALTAANITASGTLPALNGAALTALTAANITANGTLPVLNGSALTDLDAADLSTGAVPVLRLGSSGTRGSTTFLNGVNAWATPVGAANQNAWTTFTRSANGGTAAGADVDAVSETDSIDFIAGANITITGDNTNKTLTIAAAAGGAAITGTPVTNQVAVWTSATAIEGDSGLTFDGTNLGIGTNSPGEELDVQGTSTYSSTNFLKANMTGGTAVGVDIRFQGLDPSTVLRLQGGHTTNTTRNLIEARSSTNLVMQLRADGYLAVGAPITVAPRQPLDVWGAIMWGNDVGTLTHSSPHLYIQTNKSGGEQRYRTNGSSTVIMTMAANGVISGDFNDTSDERMKENIVDTDSGLDKILQLRPVSYNFKPGWGTGVPGRKRYGLIAQEVEVVFPEAVNTSPTLIEDTEEDMRTDDMLDNPKSINLGQIISTLIKSVQELKAEVDSLKS